MALVMQSEYVYVCQTNLGVVLSDEDSVKTFVEENPEYEDVRFLPVPSIKFVNI